MQFFAPSPILSCRGSRAAGALLAAGLLLAATGARAQEPSADPVARPGAEAPPEAPSFTGMRNEWRYIIIHHSASPTGSKAAFDRMHRGKGWDGVAYHFVIDNGKGGPDGRLEVSSRWWHQKHGAHAGGLPGAVSEDERNEYNEFGIGICLVGNLEKAPPTRAQMETLTRLVARLRMLFEIPEENILGHTHVKSTACPGRGFPWASLFARLGLSTPQHLHRHTPVATTGRCPWCLEREQVALNRASGPPVLPPVDAPVDEASEMPEGAPNAASKP